MKAKTTETFDWVRLSVQDTRTSAKLNMTWGRYRDTISGTLLSIEPDAGTRIGRAWVAYRNACPKGHTLGKMLQDAREAAERVQTFEELAGWLEQAGSVLREVAHAD